MLSRQHHPAKVELRPARLYALLDLMAEVETEPLDNYLEEMAKLCQAIERDVRTLAEANDSLVREAKATTRRTNPFDRFREAEEDPLSNLRHSIDGNNFIHVIFDLVSVMLKGYRHLQQVAQGFRPRDVVALEEEDRINGTPRGLEQLQTLTFQMQMNEAPVNAFVQGVLGAEDATTLVVELGRGIVNRLGDYYAMLVKRHSTEGILVHEDPITTDVALSIFENTDAHGEIADGKKPDEVTAYSVAKAVIIADSIQVGLIGKFIQQPDDFLKFLKEQLRALWAQAKALSDLASPMADKVRGILDRSWDAPYQVSSRAFKLATKHLDDLDPRDIKFREKTGLLTAEERKELEFRNQTLKVVAEMLADARPTPEIINHILERKKKLRDFHLEENSFFVCKIGAGNQFTGEAPGGLTVVPGTKPTVDLSEVIGSGFQEVRDFIGQVQSGARWFDLFVATSPSKRADKSNGLLIGPQGCHRKGQLILKYNGEQVPVEDVRVGDLLMGPDSKPREVLSLHCGREEMVEIAPVKGDPWVVNRSHILTLMRTQKSVGAYKGRPKVYTPISEIKDVVVSDYLRWSKTQKHIHVLFRVGVDFEEAGLLPLDPYFLGTLLGDGCLCGRVAVTTDDPEITLEMHRQAELFGLHIAIEAEGTSSATYHLSGKKGKLNPITGILRDLGVDGCTSGEKFIPFQYKTSSRKDRFSLLAGLIDTDGEMHGKCMDYTSKSERLAEGVAFVARSLGLAAYVSPTQKKSQNGTLGDYFRVSLSGNTDLIPTRLPRKQAAPRLQRKDVLRTSFSTCDLPPEEFFGFTTDGDHRYLLGDFTVTHNCGKTEVLRGMASDKNSIGIFAQASDFLTCWKGEAEKNPKRMFEGGLRIQRESGKQVFFLVDEVDTILNGDRGQAAFGGTNLATEFQVLMDGIMSYPHLALWGATNAPHRIPMPLLRRFSKVIIVGELDQDDRIALLKQFGGYLPLSPEMQNGAWEAAATKLDGAVGDVVRKVVDHIWREKMGAFVDTRPEEAEKLIKHLNQCDKFEVAKFTSKQRRIFLRRLKPYVVLTPEDMMRSIDHHLSNVAIKQEIETAKATYAEARKFLHDINATAS